jgi:hypothetical protein
LEKKQLVDAESQQIARIVVEMTGAEHSNPEIEQGQIAQNSIEKLRREGAIRGDQIA